MAWARSKVVAPALPLLPDQGCVSSLSISRLWILPGVAWSHRLVQASRSSKFEGPAVFEDRRQPIEAHSGCGVTRRDSLLGISSLFLGSQRVEPTIPSAPTSDVFRRDVVAACANLGLGLVFGVSRYVAMLFVRPDEGASSGEEVNAGIGKAGASAWTAEMVTNSVQPNVVGDEISAYLWKSV